MSKRRASEDSDLELDCEMPSKIMKMADEALSDILPDKSKKIYESAYMSFNEWKEENSVKLTNEKVLLAYFKKLSTEYKPTTLWSQHSMLKTMINLKENINIDSFLELAAFLKKQSHGYLPKKAKVFTQNDVKRFLETASDNQHLDKKVIMIFGIFGALRSDELVRMKIQDVERQGNIYYVKVPITKTVKPRSFTIAGEFCPYVEKYANLRPKGVSSDRYFLNYQNGKCTNQVIGKNKFSTIPQKIAEFLKLKDDKEYTGHSFRRTSATILVDAGADLTLLKRHGGWKSSSVAEGYIEESMSNKKEVSSLFSKMIDLPQTSAQPSTHDLSSSSSSAQSSNLENVAETSESLTTKLSKEKNLNFENCNITIHFN